MCAKTKPTLQERLTCRRYRQPRGIIMFLYRHIMSGFIAPRYHPHYVRHVDINDCKGPCFVIWNHLSRLDHAFVMEATYPRKLSIVAGYNEFFRSHLSFVFRLMNIIPKKNYTEDIAGIRAMHSIVRQGGCVAFSPEGMSSIYGQNQPIVPGTGRFLKSFGIPVYFVHLSGSYLTSTKACTDIRPGRVEVELSLMFTPEQLFAMSGDEIQDAINAAFRHDDYAWNKEHRIRYKSGGKICTGLDEICYKCPKCGAELQMTAQDDYIRCNVCGNGAKMNDYYDFVPFDGSCVLPESPNKWVEMERKSVIDEIRNNPEFSFTEKVRVGCLPTDHLIRHHKTSEPCGEGSLTIDHTGIHFSGFKFGSPWKWDLGYDIIYSLPIVTDTTFFSLYIDREYHDFFPERRSVGRLLLLTEEMHRMHVNTWKNFPWFEYLYR